MKNYFLLALLLLVSGLSAQIVNIPDANFKIKLINLGIDTNQDGQIQFSEAANVTDLIINSASISDLTGIAAFVNLDSLKCYDNQLTNLDVSALSNLQNLDCRINQLQSLDLSALTNLEYLTCGSNQLTNLIINPLTNLRYLGCQGNQLNNLDVSAFVNLESLGCFSNLLTSLNVNNCTSLQMLNCYDNSLSTLDVTTCTNLQRLYCSFNQLSSLDVSTSQNLQKLDCKSNFITTLDVSNLTNLTDLTCSSNLLTSLNLTNANNIQNLNCSYNQLTSLNVSALTDLIFFLCYYNQLTSLNVSGLNNLQTMDCNNNQMSNLSINVLPSLLNLACYRNQLTTIDVSTCTSLQTLYCDSNQISSLYIKNGINEPNLSFAVNPNLQYICADANQIISLQQQVLQYGMTNVSINSFCFFPPFLPNGNYNTVSGKSIFDENMNGCTLADSAYPFLMFAITDGINTGYTYTNLDGLHTTLLDSGTYTFTPQLQNPTYFSANPISTNIYFPNNNFNLQTQDFCITPNGIFPDVEIVLSPLNDARPGFDAEYQLLFHNKGTTTVSGDITVNFMGNKMTFVSASQATSAQTANQLTWNYSNLQPFESRNITFTMNLFPPTTNNIGDEIGFSAYIPLANDASPNDNQSDLKQTLVGSYDPNDKTCLEGKHLLNAKIGDYLHYLIRFQNTGNYPADHVVIVDSINVNQFDIASLQILETSHNAHITVNQGVLQFYFEDIQLADSFSNEPESHGYVLFKIKTKANLPQNSSVKNKAEIYFDYNLPIITNTEITTFANTIAVFDAIQKPHFQLYPNPAQNVLTIETEKATDFMFFNVLGEIVMSKYVSNKEQIDISALSQGVYWVKEKESYIGQRFVKE